jgi:hypothetical protein
MKPDIQKDPKIDSHYTLSKSDQRRVNNILYNNVELYYNFACEELNKKKKASSAKGSRKKVSN